MPVSALFPLMSMQYFGRGGAMRGVTAWRQGAWNAPPTLRSAATSKMGPGVRGARHDAMIPHWKQKFAVLWVGQALSILTSMLSQYALIWYLTDLTGS